MSHEHKPTTVYVKNDRGKYVPIGQYQDLDYWREGHYLVQIRPGCTSITSKLWLTRAAAEVEAVIDRLKDKLVEKIQELANEPVVKEPLNPEQLRAWKLWKKAFKADTVVLRSKHDLVDEAMNIVRHEIKKEQKYGN